MYAMPARTRVEPRHDLPPARPADRSLTLRELVEIAATKIPLHPKATNDRVTSNEARAWVFWAAKSCGVDPSTAFSRGPRWQRNSGPVKFPDSGLPRRIVRIRNGPSMDKAHKQHLDRCKVAWHMAHTPYPPRGEVASQSIIAYAMKWCDRSAVSRAIDLWEETRKRRMWGDEQ